METFIIKDSFDNHLFKDKEFESFQDGWCFIYQQYPVIENTDGTQDDREDELGEFYVVKK